MTFFFLVFFSTKYWLFTFSYNQCSSIMEPEGSSYSHSGRESSLFNLDPSANKNSCTPITDEVTLSESSSDTSSSSESDESSSTTTSSAQSLQSLAEFISINLKPFGQTGYNSYATSYITSVIPRPDFVTDDIESFTGDKPPFQDPVKVKEYQVREKRRSELGKSLRHNWIIPQSKPILKEIHLATKSQKKHANKQALEEQNRFLFHKARQWCEINKALAVDEKYPKIGPKPIRQKYSDEHKTACQKARKLSGLSDKDKIYKPTVIHSFPIPMELVIKKSQVVRESQSEENMRKMSQQVETEENGQTKLKQELNGIFAEIKPIPNSAVTADNCPWQFIARKTATIQPKRVKKQPFKKTEYPPMSKSQKIGVLRKLLPPPKPPEMETDYLSGIWQPELDIDDFHITPPTKAQIRESVQIDEKMKIDWHRLQDTKDKCKKWLEANPDNL